ncbi:MAG TPA: trypsin-like peptidase domain-containing protein, partial [Acidimicrobiales bacterium]|nr:trypsin-like peptidase domain-containing protein [Acidimicrobiales bacterium]
MTDINEPEGQPEDQGGERRPQAPGGSTPPQGGWAPPPQGGWTSPEGGWTPPQGGWAPPPPPPGWSSDWNDPSWGGAQQAGPGPTGGPYQWGPQGSWRPPQPPQGPGGWQYGWSSSNRPRRSLPGTVTALLLVIAVLVGLGIGHGVWRSIRNASGSTANGNGGITNPFNNGNGGLGNGNGGLFGGGTGNSNALNGVAATVATELVDIDTQLSFQSAEAAGTGIVLTSNGFVLTNNHVIEGATSIRATDIGNGQTYTASVVGYDRTHDVAVIKLAGASGLKTANFANSDQVSVGQQVAGLGNAGGVGGTPSEASGQVVGLNQSITAQDQANGTSEKLTNLIETNANIQEGDSGGALFDSSGRVLGMITAASTGFAFQTGGNQGFAIPINQA